MTDEFAFSEYTDFRLAYHKAMEENAELRRVLGMVEWVIPSISTGYCPWCEAWIQQGHAPDCPRQAALGLTEVQG